ncbi:MAG TPA: family 2 glycosyl transferase [Nitrospiraceae bacterium]|nr:family 2 glycosyl transferase [Nitrospiraceae bacterium]
MNNKVTIAIPTYNRSGLLKTALKSALDQEYNDYNILVLDNASTDDTEDVVRSFTDSRITYVRNNKNIGLVRNWNRTIKLNTSLYLNILQDDDIMLPGFIRESITVLEENPKAAFSFTRAGGIDINGVSVPIPGDEPDGGIIDGLEYLHQIVNGHNWVIHASTVMMRSSALAEFGPFDMVHSKHSEDVNLYLRMASYYDIAFIPKLLSYVRLHAGQDTQLRFNSPGGTGRIAMMSERTDAVAYLLQSERAKDRGYRQWLADRLLHISMRRSELTQVLVPDLNLSWTDRLEIAIEEIIALIPMNNRFILVDEDKWGSHIFSNRHVIPFLERNGRYWGAPPDDETAIQEFNRLWKSGAGFIVFGWPAFWWLDYYSGLRDYLNAKFRCIMKNSRLIVYDLSA